VVCPRAGRMERERAQVRRVRFMLNQFMATLSR
jgi:hypothetical protein